MSQGDGSTRKAPKGVSKEIKARPRQVGKTKELREALQALAVKTPSAGNPKLWWCGKADKLGYCVKYRTFDETCAHVAQTVSVQLVNAKLTKVPK